MRVKKAVIPAAGLGTRFLPVTKSMPKEMLPIIDKPIIQFAVEEAIVSGIEDIIKGDTPCIKQLVDVYQKYKNSVIAVEEVKNKNVSRYGIIKGTEIDLDKSVYRIEDIIEKPSLEEAPSNIGTVGRYILTPEIFPCIKETPVGKGNEIQLTDAIRNLSLKKKALPKKGDAYAYKFKGKRYDAGDKLGYVKAIIDSALERGDLKEEIERHLREIWKRGKEGIT